MGRQPRPNLPGATFHVTARVQGREALFTAELRSAFVAILREQIAFSDFELFAYVVMPNHVHLVVRQGASPLSRLMQPLLRRVALRVHRAYGREGHVFERRYRSHPCGTPDHLRNAIVYTHLNPIRAGLCVEPGDYVWSSHGAWVSGNAAPDGKPHPVSLERVAQIFASAPLRTPGELARDYVAFLEWRRACDRILSDHGNPESLEMLLPPSPPVEHGDLNWALSLAPRGTVRGELGSRAELGARGPRPWRPDLATIAATVLRDAEPGLMPELVRSRWGGPAYVRARHAIIRRAAAAGYRGREIAAFLRLSTTAVSDVLTAERKRFLDCGR